MSLTSIDLYETDGLLLFRTKSIIFFQMLDLVRLIEKAENIFNFYLDFNWEFRFISVKIGIFLRVFKISLATYRPFQPIWKS